MSRMMAWRWGALFALVQTLALPIALALGQDASTLISIDNPAEGATLANGTQISIVGWAADPAGPGTGVDAVRIYLDNAMDRGGTLLGEASYGSARPDVAAALGSAAFTNSGFTYRWTLSGLSTVPHTLYVYGHSVANGWANKAVNVMVRAEPTPTPRPSGAYPAPGSYPVSPYPYPGWNYGGYPYYPRFPLYPENPPYYPPYPPAPPPDHVCIMIYPPPPGC